MDKAAGLNGEYAAALWDTKPQKMTRKGVGLGRFGATPMRGNRVLYLRAFHAIGGLIGAAEEAQG